MTKLVSSILNKKFDDANATLSESFKTIMEKKLFEMKKMIAAKMFAEMDLSREKPSENIEDRRGERAVNSSIKTDLGGEQTVNRVGKGNNQSGNSTVVTKNNLKEARKYGAADAALDAASFIPGPAGSVASLGAAAASVSRGDYVGAALDAAGALPLVGYAAKAAKVAKVANAASKVSKAGRVARIASKAGKVVRRVAKGAAEVAGGIGSNSSDNSADPSKSRMRFSPTGTGSKLNVNVGNNNVNEEEQLDEARVKIIKARVRGGKVQRRKKVSNVPGMTLRGGKLTRMSPAERRKRKMGARKAKVKRKAKRTQMLMKRKRSMMRRRAMGL